MAALLSPSVKHMHQAIPSVLLSPHAHAFALHSQPLPGVGYGRLIMPFAGELLKSCL